MTADDVSSRQGPSRRAVLGGAVLLGLAACSTDPTPPTSASSAVPSGSAPARPVGPMSPAPAQAVEHGPRERPEVALTFHGEGSPVLLRQVLAVLREHQAPCTIFAVGRWLASYPEVARLVLKAGHELGNHTWSGASSAQQSAGQLRREIERCRDVLVRQTGSPGIAFRPSAMPHATGLVLAEAGHAGYAHVVTEDVDPGDSSPVGSAAIVAHLSRWTIAGSIISLQVDNPRTIAALPAVLEGLAKAQLRPVTVGRLLRP